MLLCRTGRRVFAFALFGWMPFLLGAQAPQDLLWRKAVAVAAANADWVPGLVITRSEILHKGESEGVHEMWQRSKLDQKGEVVTETVKILEDGKDVTKHEKKETNEKSGAKKSRSKGGGNP